MLALPRPQRSNLLAEASLTRSRAAPSERIEGQLCNEATQLSLMVFRKQRLRVAVDTVT
jgi:hypothetical protein